jgi:hypothetical protein
MHLKLTRGAQVVESESNGMSLQDSCFEVLNARKECI